MSESDGCELNCTCRKCKGKKRVIRIEETSDSDDSPVENATKRKKVLRVMSDGAASSSESDSFNVVAKMKKRKRAPRVMSDEEGSSPVQQRRNPSARIVSESESSNGYDSSGIDDNDEVDEDGSCSDSDRSHTDRSSEDSEWESDFTTTDDDEEEPANEPLPVAPVRRPPANDKPATSSVATFAVSDSESSDGESEKCPICLRSFTSQEVGTPESCDHSFCAMCLQEWAKNVNTCPVDRQPFTLILVRRRVGGKIIRQVAAEPPVVRDEDNEENVEEDPTFCQTCSRSDREDRMLLCDGCDSGYHLDCLNPPLRTVPIEEWFCPECVVANNTHNLAGETGIADGELMDLIDDAHAIGFSPIRPRVHRLLPRTRQSERVRATIRTRVETEAANQPSTSSGIESVDSASRVAGFFGSRPLGAVKKRKKGPLRRKKRTTRKKKPTKLSKAKSNSTGVKKKTTTVKKRKTKRKTTKRKKKVPEYDTYSDESFVSPSSSGKFICSTIIITSDSYESSTDSSDY